MHVRVRLDVCVTHTVCPRLKLVRRATKPVSFAFLIFHFCKVTQLSNLGGLSCNEKIQLVWKQLITDELGMELSWKGLNGKIPILGSLIFEAVIGKLRVLISWIHCAKSLIFAIHFLAAVGKGTIEGGKKVIEDISKDWIWTAKRRFERVNGPVPTPL